MEHRPWGVYRDIRFDGIAAGAPDPAVVSVDAIGFEAVERYDRLHVPAPRHAFLRRWIDQPGAHSVVVNEGGEVVGYGVARPCWRGFRIAPVFADRPDLAERIVAHLMSLIDGAPV